MHFVYALYVGNILLDWKIYIFLAALFFFSVLWYDAWEREGMA